MEGSRRVAIARGLALFLGGFTLLNVVNQSRWPAFDANLLWIDLPVGLPWVGTLVFVLVAIVLIAYAIRPQPVGGRRILTLVVISALLLIAVVNAMSFYGLVVRGRIHSFLPVPFSLLIAAALATILWSIGRRTAGYMRACRWTVAVTVAACLFVFPIAQMYCFGNTDYRRQADAVVVFGARTYADGRASMALRDRVRTACELYHAGLARKLVLSGGPGEGSTHETQAMRTLALQEGVNDIDIVLDPGGVNTTATVRNTCELFARQGIKRVIAVSHVYHLPRVKMAYQRAGWDVYTVPVPEPLVKTPVFVVREVAALWAYYLRPIFSQS